MTIVQSIEICDDLGIQDSAAVEVVMTLDSGERRWCFFFSPEGIAACGDWIKGTEVPFHYGAPHMIVIGTTLTEELIQKAIHDLDAQEKILSCTYAIE